MIVKQRDHTHSVDTLETDGQRSLPSCCHSGCTVCVLDYPDIYLALEQEAGSLDLPLSNTPSSKDAQLLIEAIAKAERMLDKLRCSHPES